jgi:L-methionine (R)-S-oxide reductase
VVDPAKDRELVVGPYQGTLGCLRIAFGRGVCGAAAETGQTQLVEPTSMPFRATSPATAARKARSSCRCSTAGELLAVFDVDSDQPAAFDTVDQQGLETILKATFLAWRRNVARDYGPTVAVLIHIIP